jgi:hypothetical protein
MFCPLSVSTYTVEHMFMVLYCNQDVCEYVARGACPDRSEAEATP